MKVHCFDWWAERKRKVIERARRTPAEFVTIRPLCRDTAHENTMDMFAEQQAKRVTALLEAEQQRLLRTWEDE